MKTRLLKPTFLNLLRVILKTGPTIFGDVDDEQAFLVAQGDALVI